MVGAGCVVRRVVLAAAIISGMASAALAQTQVAGFTPGSFRVSETGAAEYRIPLTVPPGVSGVVPSLSLSYNSQGSNGLLGIGWAMGGLSVVHRCGRSIVQDGSNAGLAWTSADRYCMDGQRLVAVNGSYGANDTEYRTERESFTRIVSYGSAGSGPESFKAWTKSGLILSFGATADSRIEAQGRSDVRLWAVNRIEDRKGNAMTVSYSEDNANGHYHPVRIDYTSNSGQSLSAGQSVRFSYATRSDTNVQQIAGTTVSTQQRMTNVVAWVGETAVRDYRIAYDNGGYGGASRVVSVTECSGDGTICLKPIVPAWLSASGGTGFASPSGWGASSVPTRGARFLIADADGDGIGDLIYANTGGVHVRYSSGSGFGTATYVAADQTGCLYMGEVSCEVPVWVFAAGDLNGDGKADIVTGDGTVYLSTGGGFSSAGNWGIAPNGGLWGASIVDLNGDGLGDLVYVAGTSIKVAYSTGSSFTGVSTLATDTTGCYQMGEVSCDFGLHARFVAGDFDGDGRADVMTGAGVVHLSTGSGFTSAGNWGATLTGVWTAHAADANGDGRADLVLSAPASTAILVRYSSGSGFGSASAAADDGTGCMMWSEVCTSPYAIFAAGDATGDGLPDIVSVQYAGLSTPVYAATAPSPDRVSRFTDSLEAQVDIAYAALSNGAVYTMESGATWPARELRPQVPLQVVSSSVASNGIGGTRTTSYVYRGGRVHHKGGGFLGFREVEAIDAGTGIRTVSSFRQDHPYRGLPIETRRLQSSGTVIGKATNTWTDATLTPASGSGGTYHKSELTQIVEENRELSGALVTTVTTTNTHDAYGNVLSVVVSTGDGYSKTTTNTYLAPDTTNWILGRLSTATVTAVKP